MNIGADGLKTGFTKEAGYGLVGSAVQNGMRLIVVVNGLKTEKERADEAKKLLEWGFHAFEANVLFAEGQSIGEAKVYGGAQGSVPLVAERPVQLMVPRGVREKIIARVVYTGPVPAPVQKGQQIGMLKVWRGDVIVLEVPLQAAESVGTAICPAAPSTPPPSLSSACSAPASSVYNALKSRPQGRDSAQADANARTIHHLRRRRGHRQVDPGGAAGAAACARSASASCSRASPAARPAPRSSAMCCCRAPPSRSGRAPRRSCSRPRAPTMSAPPSSRRWRAATG